MCLIGRNGTGKSTLLNVIGHEQALDSGNLWLSDGLKIVQKVMLCQTVPLLMPRNINAPQLDPLIPFSAGTLLSTIEDIQRYIDQVHRKNTLGDEVRDIPRPEPSRSALTEIEISQLIGDYDVGQFRVGVNRIGIIATDSGIAARFGGADVDSPAIPLIQLEGRRFIAAHDDEMEFTFDGNNKSAKSLSLFCLGGAIGFSRNN